MQKFSKQKKSELGFHLYDASLRSNLSDRGRSEMAIDRNFRRPSPEKRNYKLQLERKMSEEEGSKMDVDTPVEEEKKIDLNVNPSASADSASKHPNMALAQDIHRLVMSTGPKALISNAEDLSAAGISPELNAKVLKKVVSDIENPSLYRHLQPILNWSSLSDKELDEMDSKHVETLKELEDKVEKSRESAGDMEVLESRFEVARFSAKSLSKDEAFEAYDKVLALPKLSSGKTIDALMEQSRVSSFHGDMQKYSKLIERAVKLAGDGGDWDRRNRLKVYNAFSKIADRDLKTAASLLVDCIATFSCDELCTYTDFVVYTIITNILYLPRTELKEKIIDGPEIISIINEIPIVVSILRIFIY